VADGGLARLGWDLWFAAARCEISGEGPVGRVARVDRGWASVLTDPETELRLPIDPGADVAAGDWVVVEAERVGAVLPRRSSLARRAAGRATRVHVLAANVDTIFLVHSLSSPPKPRRLERELVLAFESGASPVVVLNKMDLATDPTSDVAAVEEVALAVPVHAVSARTGEGLEKLHASTAGHHTIALLGPSGAGKSTLVNALAGDDVQRTAAVRSFDQKGRHTTTAAQLVLLPDGGLLLDTPGLRAVALWSEGGGLARAFDDITALAEGCWFADCRHDQEPDCAVRDAVVDGRLDPKRLGSWQHLTAELDRLEEERAVAERAARRGRPPRVVESDADDVAGE
jgi:ribosome biogenesis GTPase